MDTPTLNDLSGYKDAASVLCDLEDTRLFHKANRQTVSEQATVKHAYYYLRGLTGSEYDDADIKALMAQAYDYYRD